MFLEENFNNNNELIQQALKELLYTKLIEQLIKDFSLANISFDVPEDIKNKELQKLLHEKLYVLIMEKFNDYLNLLYVIDVPEKVFKEIKVTDVVEVAEQVSFLILKREFQKVRLKAKYT
mgnify:CR=1 FL=1